MRFQLLLPIVMITFNYGCNYFRDCKRAILYDNDTTYIVVECNENKTGYLMSFYPNGSPEAFVLTKNGKKDGKRLLYYENGKLKSNEQYKNGEGYGHRYLYFSNGKPESYRFYGYNGEFMLHQKFDSITGQYSIESGHLIDTIALVNRGENIIKFMVAQPFGYKPKFEILLFDTLYQLEKVECKLNANGEYVYHMNGKEFTGFYTKIVANVLFEDINAPDISGGDHLIVNESILMDEKTFVPPFNFIQ